MPTLATFFLLLFPLLSQTTANPSAEHNAAKDIAAAVRRLASNDFATREEATEELWRAGPAARPALEAAAESDDREVALRARSVLEKFRFGIFPDTPPETLALIETVRTGQQHEQIEALRKLQGKRQWSTLVALVRAETSDERRRDLTRSFEDGMRRGAQEELSRGDIDSAEALLSWMAECDESELGQSLRHYASLLLHRGKLAAAIDRIKNAGEYGQDRNRARLLARLLQVQGNLREAKSVAELTDDKYLKADLYYRLEDWETLAQMTPAGRGVEPLGFTATFYRLAENKAGLERAVADLRALALREPDRRWLCAEAMMINERWEEAIDVVPAERSNYAFECQCGRMKFADAFRVAGIADPRSGAADWFVRRATVVDPASKEAASHFELGLSVARALATLGERKESACILAELAKQPDDAYWGRSFNLLRAEENAGLSEQLKQRALAMLSKKNGIYRVMYHWYAEKQAGTASWWWKFLSRIAPDEDREVTLLRLQRLMRPGELIAAADNLVELAGRAEQWSIELKLEERVAALGYIGELCALQKDLKLAREYLEKQAKLARDIRVAEFEGYNPPRTVSPLLRIGDLYAQEKSWLEAAEAYGRAWQLHKERAASLYLQGHALEQAGQRDEGRRLMELADLLPLANMERREELAETMDRLGHGQAAIQQWELILRLGAFEGWEGSEDWAVKRACRALAEHLADKDKLRAANLWQHYLHYMLKTNVGFTEASGYPEVVHLIHRQRALGLLEAQRVDEALPELDLAQAAMPGDVELVETAIPILTRAGRRSEADRLFAEAYEAYDKVCRDFPNSAAHHNRLAWLSARCDKRLDDAIVHGQRAVELDGDNMAYVDTLAEVHFRRGDVQRAIAMARQAVEREPNNKHFQQQLSRFRSRD